MYPAKCHTYTSGQITLMTKDGTILSSTYADDYTAYNYLEFDYLKAGSYILSVTNNWSPNDVKDFTVKVYAASKVNITQWTDAQMKNYTSVQMKKALQNHGESLDYSSGAYFPQFSSQFMTGPGFTYFELNANDVNVNLTLTLYVGNVERSIFAKNATCGVAQVSKTYGFYYNCQCVLPAYNYSYPIDPMPNMTKAAVSKKVMSLKDQIEIHTATDSGELAPPTFDSYQSSSSSSIWIPDKPDYQYPPYCAFVYEGNTVQFSYAFNG